MSLGGDEMDARVANFPDIRQRRHDDCGATCLAALAAFIDSGESADDLLNHLHQSGITSAYDIIAAARTLRLDAVGVQATARNLEDSDLPAILHWDDEHFVVALAIRDETVTIFDPSRGKRSIALTAMLRHHSGVTILFGGAARRFIELDRRGGSSTLAGPGRYSAL